MKALRPWPHSLSQGVPVTEQWAWRGAEDAGSSPLLLAQADLRLLAALQGSCPC